MTPFLEVSTSEQQCNCSTYTCSLLSRATGRLLNEQTVCLGAMEDLDVYTLYMLWGESLLSGNKRGKENTPFSLY